MKQIPAKMCEIITIGNYTWCNPSLGGLALNAAGICE